MDDEKKFVFTPIGLTTVTRIPVPNNSCWSDSENPSMANFEPQYAAKPGIQVAASDATFIICPFFFLNIEFRNPCTE